MESKVFCYYSIRRLRWIVNKIPSPKEFIAKWRKPIFEKSLCPPTTSLHFFPMVLSAWKKCKAIWEKILKETSSVRNSGKTILKNYFFFVETWDVNGGHSIYEIAFILNNSLLEMKDTVRGCIYWKDTGKYQLSW